MVEHITPSEAISIARQIVTRGNTGEQCYMIDRSFYLGHPQYNVLGTIGQFMEWCQAIISHCCPSSQKEVFEALLEANADRYALCRICGIALTDFQAVCNGTLQIDLPFHSVSAHSR